MTSTVTGEAFPRIEARAKVTGSARYTADHHPDGLLYAVLVGAPVAAGRLRCVDPTAALELPGVISVLTAADLPDFPRLSEPSGVTVMPFTDSVIHYEGQPVAVVLGDTLEAAEAGRALVSVDCERTDPVLLGAGMREPAPGEFGGEFDKGYMDAAWSAAAIRIEHSYLAPPRHHHAMETSGTVAQWHGDDLALWDSVQASATVPPVIAHALDIDPGRIRIIARHIGGGFGSKSYVWPHEILAAAAARITGRAVKLHLRRADQFSNVGYQPWMEQTMRLAADEAGRLTGIEHTAVNNAGMVDTHVEPATLSSRNLYAAGSIRTRQLIERVNLNVPTPMRAPLEGMGQWALESAMNELAEAAGLDPLDVRLANFAEVSPADGRPWSSNRLTDAYAEGARRYGWRERHDRPRTDGPWLIGHGMATCTMGSFRFPSAARVRVRGDGTVLVETNVPDIGTGVPTIVTQIAADELGVSRDRVEMCWGDTALPAGGPSYGSSITMGAGSAVAAAARNVVEQLTARGVDGMDAASLRAAGIDEVIGDGRFATPGGAMNLDGEGTPSALRTWGAIFVEVGVDRDFGLLRLRRAVGVYSAGRIMNPVTARAQMIGGIIWGWGKATLEASDQEPSHGRWLVKNLSNVAIPVNADIPTNLDVSFTDEYDGAASLIGARGIGELGATGVDAAVAAAVHDAVGIRVRELPILPWKVLGALDGSS